VTKPEWGTKRVCASCGKRFYDLNKTPITCPQCGTVLEFKKPTRPARSEAAKAEPKKVVPVAAAPAAEEWAGAEAEDLGDGEEAAEGDENGEQEKDVIEDASDLGEDEDDVLEVKEHLNSPADE
jgi:uncharacterized protein (TIGR02300 family)